MKTWIKPPDLTPCNMPPLQQVGHFRISKGRAPRASESFGRRKGLPLWASAVRCERKRRWSRCPTCPRGPGVPGRSGSLGLPGWVGWCWLDAWLVGWIGWLVGLVGWLVEWLGLIGFVQLWTISDPAQGNCPWVRMANESGRWLVYSLIVAGFSLFPNVN